MLSVLTALTDHTLVAHMASAAQAHGHLPLLADDIPTPGPSAPPGVANPVSNIISWVKYGALACLAISIACTVGAFAIGKLAHSHGGFKWGFGFAAGSILSAIAYAALPSILAAVIG